MMMVKMAHNLMAKKHNSLAMASLMVLRMSVAMGAIRKMSCRMAKNIIYYDSGL